MRTFLEHASELYTIEYFGAILALAALEAFVPRRTAGDSLQLRWTGNFGLSLIGSIVVRAVFPLAGIAWATYCHDRGWGLFNHVSVPPTIAILVVVLAIDFVNYTKHVVLHKVPPLWAVHRTHHTDLDYDFSTALRFHPLEGIVSTALQLSLIFTLGAPAFAVLIAQLLTSGLTFLEHANVRLPDGLDRVLRLVFVTPDMHRIHHSRDVHEGETNFATIFSWWDRLFGTYLHAPAGGHDAILFGVADFTDRKHLALHWMLAQPFLRGRRAADRKVQTSRS
jgi:sterol desaturase/sphingolipid hydroxylase (fatty acid hydroxylase superfamily)